MSLRTRRREPTSIRQNKPAWYAEYDDNYMNVLLDNDLTKKLLRDIVDKRYGCQLDAILSHSIELRQDNFPQFYEVFSHCCDTLGIYECPNAYITNCLSGINALTLEVYSQVYVLISRDVVFTIDHKEQSFLIGHELGHYQQGNLVCHTVNGLFTKLTRSSDLLGTLLADAIEVPLKRWCRQCEFNADRAGYLCCEDLSAIKRLFLSLGMIQTTDEYSLYKQLSAEHPLLETRFQKLYSFFVGSNYGKK